MLTLDHIVVTCATLEAGAEAVEAALGVAPEPGGAHPVMSTHNRLLYLGHRLYLEVIAPDPSAPAPGRARWFALDELSGPPRLSHWVARTDGLDAELAESPTGTGTPMELSRGTLAWRMAVSEDGRLPFDGLYPALIEWSGAAHPADTLSDAGCRLELLEVDHPRADDLHAVFTRRLQTGMVTIQKAESPALRARIATPTGPRWLT